MEGIVGLSAQRPTSDVGLVRSATQGDRVAFAALVDAHHADIVRACHVVCGDVEQTRDAVQSAWHQIWRKLGQLRDQDKFRAWAIAIAVNEARAARRKDRRRELRELAITSGTPSSAEPFQLADQRMDLARALNTLSPDDRALLALRYVAGMTPAELARVVGGTESGLRGRLSRINRRLREEMR